MSLALLSGVNPRVCKNGPRVRLHEGKWKLNCVGLVDTKLTLCRAGAEIHEDVKDGYVFDGNCTIALVIMEKGNEQHFSVFAEPVKNGTIVSTT